MVGFQRNCISHKGWPVDKSLVCTVQCPFAFCGHTETLIATQNKVGKGKDTLDFVTCAQKDTAVANVRKHIKENHAGFDCSEDEIQANIRYNIQYDIYYAPFVNNEEENRFRSHTEYILSTTKNNTTSAYKLYLTFNKEEFGETYNNIKYRALSNIYTENINIEDVKKANNIYNIDKKTHKLKIPWYTPFQKQYLQMKKIDSHLLLHTCEPQCVPIPCLNSMGARHWSMFIMIVMCADYMRELCPDERLHERYIFMRPAEILGKHFKNEDEEKQGQPWCGIKCWAYLKFLQESYLNKRDIQEPSDEQPHSYKDRVDVKSSVKTLVGNMQGLLQNFMHSKIYRKLGLGWVHLKGQDRCYYCSEAIIDKMVIPYLKIRGIYEIVKDVVRDMHIVRDMHVDHATMNLTNIKKCWNDASVLEWMIDSRIDTSTEGLGNALTYLKGTTKENRSELDGLTQHYPGNEIVIFMERRGLHVNDEAARLHMMGYNYEKCLDSIAEAPVVGAAGAGHEIMEKCPHTGLILGFGKFMCHQDTVGDKEENVIYNIPPFDSEFFPFKEHEMWRLVEHDNADALCGQVIMYSSPKPEEYIRMFVVPVHNLSHLYTNSQHTTFKQKEIRYTSIGVSTQKKIFNHFSNSNIIALHKCSCDQKQTIIRNLQNDITTILREVEGDKTISYVDLCGKLELCVPIDGPLFAEMLAQDNMNSICNYTYSHIISIQFRHILDESIDDSFTRKITGFNHIHREENIYFIARNPSFVWLGDSYNETVNGLLNKLPQIVCQQDKDSKNEVAISEENQNLSAACNVQNILQTAIQGRANIHTYTIPTNTIIKGENADLEKLKQGIHVETPDKKMWHIKIFPCIGTLFGTGIKSQSNICPPTEYTVNYKRFHFKYVYKTYKGQKNLPPFFSDDVLRLQYVPTLSVRNHVKTHTPRQKQTHPPDKRGRPATTEEQQKKQKKNKSSNVDDGVGPSRPETTTPRKRGRPRKVQPDDLAGKVQPKPKLNKNNMNGGGSSNSTTTRKRSPPRKDQSRAPPTKVQAKGLLNHVHGEDDHGGSPYRHVHTQSYPPPPPPRALNSSPPPPPRPLDSSPQPSLDHLGSGSLDFSESEDLPIFPGSPGPGFGLPIPHSPMGDSNDIFDGDNDESNEFWRNMIGDHS